LGSGTPTTGTVALGPRLPETSLRAGLIHYNTRAEVDRLVEELGALKP
jgi:selenocysteine lyase/cysteine desulfurase